MKQLFKYCLVMLTILASLSALSAQAAQESPVAVVKNSVDALMSKLENRRDYYNQHHNELKSLVNDTLDPIVDYHYISAGVMGKYFKAASPEQRSRFSDVFKQTLIDTYSNGLVTFDYETLRVLDEQSPQRYEDQANVQMEIIARNGQSYPVSFTLKQRQNGWKVINVVVNGINLGLTFRNQFDQAMRDNNRDFDRVISSWSPDVDLQEGGQDGQPQ
ncbi:MlaC/ttg2D family ABC transporter substrate-binding protein [Phytohalomonas tamaricis]|uniref:MlaC/ttg2D family ABC transporter substrate-binding protein n=1 Tax=Phytohalomonas tamaricis TaxID=2081032 RepID=UPI000D0B66E3|nr:ABC transporter substrate-binding protein [Phytohalomonas tamaricis]